MEKPKEIQEVKIEQQTFAPIKRKGFVEKINKTVIKKRKKKKKKK